MSKQTQQTESPWVVGEAYFIRTVTYHYTGRLVAVTDRELVFTDAAWIPDSGRFSQFLLSGKAAEVEPYPDNARVILGRECVIDGVQFVHPLPRGVV